MTNLEAPETEAEVLRRGIAMLAERLPAGWTTRVIAPESDARVAALIEVSGADGNSAFLVAEAKRVLEGRDVGPLRDQIEEYAGAIPGRRGLIVARYLSPPVRAKLAEAGLSYIDATGNMRVELESPGLFVSDRGANRDPWRGPGRPRGTLKGTPAARIVRAVTDFAGPWAIREIIEVAKVSTGATYRVVDYLEREGLANRDESGLVNVPDWARLLRQWSDDYGFVRNSRTTRWIAPRGVPDLMERIASASSPSQYAVTGTLAAAQWAAYAPARLAMIYVENAAEAADTWGLRAADAGANAILAEPEIDVVFERTKETVGGAIVAAPTQVVVDLMTGPGRSPSEAEELLTWMKKNEQSWRN